MKKLLVICVASVLSLSTLTFASDFSDYHSGYYNISDVSPNAVVPPTELSPYLITNGDWSGTINYTYTRYYFEPGIFMTTASTNHSVEYFTLDGRLISSHFATYNNGVYRTQNEISVPYYAVISNIPWSVPANNANYTAIGFIAP